MTDCPLPRGMLLDLDDTILTYDAISRPAWRAACEAHAGDLDPGVLYETLHAVRRWYWGDPERHRLGRLNLDETRIEVTLLGLRRLGVSDREWAARLAGAFTAARDAATGFFPGAEEALLELRRRGVALASMTNGAATPQRAKIERFDLERHFDAVLIEGEMGFGKPDPRVYETALWQLGLKPEEVWAVGDNLEWDVAGPQRLGIYGIWHDYHRQGLPEGVRITPDRIISSLSELVRRA